MWRSSITQGSCSRLPVPVTVAYGSGAERSDKGSIPERTKGVGHEPWPNGLRVKTAARGGIRDSGFIFRGGRNESDSLTSSFSKLDK